MSKRMKHSKTVKIRFTNPEYQAVKITAYKKGYSVPELLRVLCTIAGAESDPLLNPGTIKIIQNHTLCQIWNYIYQRQFYRKYDQLYLSNQKL